jgi:hypothetical protein
MDQRERAGDPYEAMRAAMDGRQTTIWTALPGIVQSFDATKMTCVIQPAIQGRVTSPKGLASFVNLPLLLDCPVVFPGGGGVTLTFAIKKGDEALVVFASRGIDYWWQQGGIQPPAEIRMHDLSDGFALVGVRSQPRNLSNISTTHAQLRSTDGLAFVDLDPTGHVVKIQATTATTATFSPSGIALVSPTLTHNGVNIGDTHVHGGVQGGASNTLVPH